MNAIVFTTRNAAFTYAASIDTSFGYPRNGVRMRGARNVGTTTRYQGVLKHPTLNLWAYVEDPIVHWKIRSFPVVPPATRQELNASWIGAGEAT